MSRDNQVRLLRKGLLISFLVLVLTFLPPCTGDAAQNDDEQKKAHVPEATQTSLPLLPCRFLDARGFSWMLSLQDAAEVPLWRSKHPLAGVLPEQLRDEPLQGLVLPHHDVASPMTARILSEASVILSRFSERQPETIILLGPNHARSGEGRIQTFAVDWKTPTGIFPLARDWHDLLVREYGAAGEVALMEREHSLAYLIPWLHHFFPDTTVLPILIHGNLDRKGCERLSQTLAAFAGERKTLIVSSVDFSHGILPKEALISDETTWKTVESGDIGKLLGLDNRYLDAPPTMATMGMTMSTLKAGTPYLTGHAEASLFLGTPLVTSTSYLCMAYSQAQ